jgi:hypothetical protein
MAPGSDAAPCELLAALTDDRRWRARALQRAAERERARNPARADSLLLLAAAADQPSALAAYGRVQVDGDEEELVRREALIEARRAGSNAAAAALGDLQDELRGQALAHPDRVGLLLGGRALEIPDDLAVRRYLVGFGDGLERVCIFEAAVFDTAAFRRAKDEYSAPLAARSHVRIVTGVAGVGAAVARGVGGFASDLWNGKPYTDAAATLIRVVRQQQHRVNHAAAVSGEDGARDAVRAASLVNGCGSAQGLRMVRGLTALYRTRAGLPLEGK